MQSTLFWETMIDIIVHVVILLRVGFSEYKKYVLKTEIIIVNYIYFSFVIFLASIHVHLVSTIVQWFINLT